LSQFECHGAHALACGYPVYCRGYLGGAMLKLALKLADEECRLLLIALLEDLPNADQNGPRHRGHRGCYCEREEAAAAFVADSWRILKRNVGQQRFAVSAQAQIADPTSNGIGAGKIEQWNQRMSI
jgi:hypothetical protein